MQCSSRVSACRREPNSHNAAKPRAVGPACGPSPSLPTPRLSAAGNRPALLLQLTSGRGNPAQMPLHQSANSNACTAWKPPSFSSSVGPQAAFVLSFPVSAGGLKTWRPRTSSADRLASAAEQQESPRLGTHAAAAQKCTALPNPSLKRSANGRPPGPGHRYGVHFLWPGPGALPLSPA